MIIFKLSSYKLKSNLIVLNLWTWVNWAYKRDLKMLRVKNFFRDSEAKMISIDILLNRVKFMWTQQSCPIVGLFMPSQSGTKVSFLRAIFSNKKKALK